MEPRIRSHIDDEGIIFSGVGCFRWKDQRKTANLLLALDRTGMLHVEQIGGGTIAVPLTPEAAQALTDALFTGAVGSYHTDA